MVRVYQATRVNRSSPKWQDRIRPTTIVGGPDWDRRTVHIEGNGCATCHRAPDPERFLGIAGHDVNSFMPPNAPGSMTADYAAIRACYAMMDRKPHLAATG